jgi:GNAT superfamily N-acetyltransferase
MKRRGIFYEVLDRRTYDLEKGAWAVALTHGWVCKYRDGTACFDFSLPNDSSFAVVAVNNKRKIVGVLKFEYNGRWRKLQAGGTFVRRDFRRRGIAKQLWRCAVDYVDPERIHITVVSDRGHTLAQRLHKLFPWISFSCREEAKRKLRDLRKRRARAA